MHQIFAGQSLAQRAVSEFFIFFYIFNFNVVFFMSFIYVYFEIKTHNSIILNFVIQSKCTTRVANYSLNL
jgi:hypothetical protein